MISNYKTAFFHLAKFFYIKDKWIEFGGKFNFVNQDVVDSIQYRLKKLRDSLDMYESKKVLIELITKYKERKEFESQIDKEFESQIDKEFESQIDKKSKSWFQQWCEKPIDNAFTEFANMLEEEIEKSRYK